ncbi:MAG: DUF4293 domain-containing protein [Prevotellaceae bacterium]|jgi:hypothetical protein|nr:DUF4293 domain-containing protein [Prevotellaceae bacterium]
MIQRIQTVYLFAVVVLQSVLLSSSIAKYTDLQGVEHVYAMTDFVAMAILTSLTAIIPAISLFVYRKRIVQARLNIYNSIILTALQIFILYYVISIMNQIELFKFSVPSVFPVISLIFSILAIRKIFKDDLLVKSLNRIRK